MVKSKTKKFLSAVIAIAMLGTVVSSMPLASSAETADKYEFENGTYVGAELATEQSGYSGSGYIFLKDAGQTASVNITVPSTGMYSITVAYNLPEDFVGGAGGSKIQNLIINDQNQGQIAFTASDGFEELLLGTYKLNEGKNVITIESSWGWTMFDYITIQQAVLPELQVNNTLADKSATKETQSLMNYLTDVYGKHIISGQQEVYGVADETEFEYIYGLSGVYPAIRGFDLGNYDPLFNWDNGSTSRMIDWVNNRKGIATASWHVNVPKDMTTYTVGQTMDWAVTTYKPTETNFVTANVLVDGTKENGFFKLAVRDLAEQLKKAQDANVPIIFRPFHEAEGNGGINGEGAWFWWGSAGAETYKELWELLYNSLTEDYGLHNLIWEFNSYTYENSKAWYPGDAYVDIVGYDKYNATNWSTGTTSPNESAISGTFYNLVDMYDGKKLIAMSENDTIPRLDNLIEESAGWLYFCPWYREYLMDPKNNNADTVAELYKSEYVISLDELPSNLYSYELGGSEETQSSETTTTITETTSESTDVSSSETTTIESNTTPSESSNSDDTSISSSDSITSDETTTTETSEITDTDTEPESTTTFTQEETTTTSETETTEEVDLTKLKYGDVDLNGVINISDVIKLNKYLVKSMILNATQKENADCVHDGKIEVKDNFEIVRCICRIISESQLGK